MLEHLELEHELELKYLRIALRHQNLERRRLVWVLETGRHGDLHDLGLAELFAPCV